MGVHVVPLRLDMPQRLDTNKYPPSSRLLVVQHGMAVIECAPLDVLPSQAHRVCTKVEAQQGISIRPCCTLCSQTTESKCIACSELWLYIYSVLFQDSNLSVRR